MTYGEAWFDKKQNLNIKKVVNECIPGRSLPKRMDREKAGKYYNTKLFNHWIKKLDGNLPLERREQIISLFMFGHKERDKLFKEKL